MKIEWIKTEEEQRRSIIAQGKELSRLAQKFWDGEELSYPEKYIIAKSLFWLGNDMQKKSSRYLEPKKHGGQSELPEFDILTEYYGYILDEGRTQTYAFEKLMEKYKISDRTIRNMIKKNGEDVKQFWWGE